MFGEQKIANQSYTVNEVNGVAAARVVVIDPTDPVKIKYPAGANARKTVGVTNNAVLYDKPASICVLGVVYVQIASAVVAGDKLCTGDAEGRVAAIPVGVTPAGNYWCVGEARSSGDTLDDLVLMARPMNDYPVTI